ncbi:MAG: hypothetical protein IK084_00310 [Bacteroidaceae bacterium]|nr:hypothetical protein [Bacteroidaceae bacterium]
MDKIQQIRKEIERRKDYISVTHFAEELLSFLDTHPLERASQRGKGNHNQGGLNMAEDCRKCFFFEKVNGEDWPEGLPYHCKYTRSLFSQQELDNGIMGKHCRPFDAFCPKDAPNEVVSKILEWDGEDYEGYFSQYLR